MIICNLQDTFMENLASMHIWSESDMLMTRVMNGLGYTIPTFILKRKLVVKMEKDSHGRQIVLLTGVDNDGTPVTYLKSVKLENSRRVIRAEPFSFTFRETLEIGAELEFVLEFMGHYNEPNVVVSYVVPEDDNVASVFDLHYDPSTGEWMTMRS
jgi:mono-ADP-ribosyltransferase sirtuin 6